MTDSVAPMIAFIAVIAVSQIINHRTQTKLTAEQKLALMDSSGKIPWTLILIAVALGLQIWLSGLLGHPLWLEGAFLFLLLLILASSLLVTLRRFRRLGLPAGYIRVFTVTQLCVYAVLCFLFWGSYANIKEITATTSRLLQNSKRDQ